MIKVISFDIGNTIYVTNKFINKLEIISKIFSIDYFKIKQAYKNTFQIMNQDFDSICSDFCKKLNIDYNQTTKSQLKNVFISNSTNYEYVDDSIIDLLKKLKNHGYIIITFSDNCKHNYHIDKVLGQYVDYTFNSYELGFLKTDSQAYHIIEKKLKVHSNEILHIGDNFNTDYLFPIINGWNAFLYNNKDNLCIRLNDIEKAITLLNGIHKNSVVLSKNIYLYLLIYQMEQVRLKYIFDNNSIEIYHIGSTSIPGLLTKPIVDIAVLVNNLFDILPYVGKMKSLGYGYRNDHGEKGEYLFYRGNKDQRYVYIHVIERESIRWKNFFYFKKCLLEHKEIILQYNNLKKRLLLKYPNNRKKYTLEKGIFIQKIINQYKSNL